MCCAVLWHQLTCCKSCIWSLPKPRIVSVRGSGGGVVLVAPVPCADAHLVRQKRTALWKCRTEPYLLRVIKTRSREADRIFPEHVGSALNMFDRIIHMTKAQEKGMRSCPTSFSSFELFCLSSTCRYFHFPPFKFKFNLEILNEVSPHTTTTSCRDPGT